MNGVSLSLSFGYSYGTESSMLRKMHPCSMMQAVEFLDAVQQAIRAE